jgi:serine/threonine protein kinase/formylglycine-generating enzyme required for sulfatase activity
MEERRDSAAVEGDELLVRFLERYPFVRGEGFDLRAFEGAHPELGERLRAFLADLEGSLAGEARRPVSRVQPLPGSTAARRASAPDSDLSRALLARLIERGPGQPRYELRDELARGGQGRVVRVWDEELGRLLAMKVTHDSHTAAEAKPHAARTLGRFLEEARLTGQLDHPGIVPVHELGIDGEGRIFFTMKLVKGRDLKEVFALVHGRREGWTETRALSVFLRVCEGMAYAHSKGVIHRDLKPANVMVGRFGEVFVMDWGLARVLDQPDTRDLRLAEPLLTTQVHSLRHGPASSELDASLVTMDGDVVGTPAYMSPEQARGELERMGPHSDVYSAGAMLYHLLAGHPPYLPPGTRLNNYAIWSRVQEGPPAPLHTLAPQAPAELLAIAEKAMARDPAARYRDMSELGEDLRAFLEHRVVKAYETGALAELRKWVGRNRGPAVVIAAALLLALGGLAAAGWIESRRRADSERQGGIARAHALDAEANAAEAGRQAEAAARERANVLRLSAFLELDDLRSRAEALWPVRPALRPQLDRWLADAHRLAAGLHGDPGRSEPGHYAVLAELRARAIPTPEPVDPASRSKLQAELEETRARSASLRLALELRAGREAPPAFELPPALAQESAKRLNELAWPLVELTRTIHGREAEGLALARRALALISAGTERLQVLDTLSKALHAVGLDDEALEVAREAVAEAPPSGQAKFRRYLAEIQQAIELRARFGPARLDRLARRQKELEWELSDRTFASDEDRWWHTQLTRLVGEIEALGDEELGLAGHGLVAGSGWGVARRRAFADELAAMEREGSEERRLWDEAIASIADSAVCPDYAGLRLEARPGFVPIGRDPRSGLWEFVDLQTGRRPFRDERGELVLDAETGVVFVLVPGGVFLMGAQANAAWPGFDPFAQHNEGPPQDAEVESFFIAKHELNQAQWMRVTGTNPSTYAQSLGTETNPLESVSWVEARIVLARLGFELPSEAQWEYAVRGWTTTPWWTGETIESLEGAVSVLDRSASQVVNLAPLAKEAELDDGFPVYAPVHKLRANPFGLHGTIGNVHEMCRDLYAPRHDEPPEPAARPGAAERVVRGGSFERPPRFARSAAREGVQEDKANASVGLRPVMNLR